MIFACGENGAGHWKEAREMKDRFQKTDSKPAALMTIVAVVSLGLSACAAPEGIASSGWDMMRQEAVSGVSNVKQLSSGVRESMYQVNSNWDEALAPIPCKNLKNVPPFWRITGSVVAYGVLYSDGPISDPAAADAIARKFANHIGPGC